LRNQIGLNVLSPGAKRLLTTDDAAQATLWDLETMRTLTSVVTHSEVSTGKAVAWADFSADGQQLITVRGRHTPTDTSGQLLLFNDGFATLWNAITGAQVARLGQAHWVIERSAFSPDGRRVALALRGGEVQVLALPQGNPLTSFVADMGRGGDTRWRGVAFSADGQRIVTSSRAVAQVWRAADGRALARMAAAHGDSVGRTVFTPDGQRLVSFADKTARVWDAATGAEVAVLAQHSKSITGLSIAPNGHRVLTGSVDGDVRAWPLFASTDALVQHAQQAVTRCLGPDERLELNLSAQVPCWCHHHSKWWPPAEAERGAAASSPSVACAR
jgi:WD40 repeat protein